MTERLAQVEHRIQTVHQLEGVVRAMRGIASTRVQECRTYLVGIGAVQRGYRRSDRPSFDDGRC